MTKTINASHIIRATFHSFTFRSETNRLFKRFKKSQYFILGTKESTMIHSAFGIAILLSLLTFSISTKTNKSETYKIRSPSSIKLNEKLTELIALYRLNTDPYTLTFLGDSLVEDQLDWHSISEDPRILPSSTPKSPPGFNREQVQFSTCIVIMSIDAYETLEEALDLLKAVSNRKRDFFIFISKSASALETFMASRVIERIQEKVGLLYSETDDDPLKDVHLAIEDRQSNSKSNLKYLEPSKPFDFPRRNSIGYNLRGRHLRCSGALVGSYIFATDTPNQFGEKLDGTHYRVVSEASNHLNYTFESYAPPGQSYGTLLKNGTWIGMLADILYEDRDYDIGYNLAHVLVWNEYVDYAATLSQIRVTFVTRHPETLSLKMKAFLLPFQLSVWIAILASFVSIFSALYFFLKFNPNNNKPASIEPKVNSSSSSQQPKGTDTAALYNAIMLPYSLLMEQGINIPPGARWLSALWLWCVINMGTGYKSNLVSYLSIPMKDVIPRDMEDLANRPDYTLKLNVIGAVEKLFFEQTELRRAKEISQRLQFEPDTNKCVKDALDNPKKVACLGWDQPLTLAAASSFTLESQIPPLFLSGDGLSATYLTLGIRKDSKYLDGIKSVSSAFLESGISQKWQEEVYLIFKRKGLERMKDEKNQNTNAYGIVKKYVDEQGGSTQVKSFKVDNLLISFVVLILGLIIAATVFIIEYAFCRKTSTTIIKV
jgi:hypothetical protein